MADKNNAAILKGTTFCKLIRNSSSEPAVFWLVEQF